MFNFLHDCTFNLQILDLQLFKKILSGVQNSQFIKSIILKSASFRKIKLDYFKDHHYTDVSKHIKRSFF